MTDYERRVWQAMGCAKTLIKHGTPAGLAISRAATKYGVNVSDVASKLGQRAAHAKAWRK